MTPAPLGIPPPPPGLRRARLPSSSSSSSLPPYRLPFALARHHRMRLRGPIDGGSGPDRTRKTPRIKGFGGVRAQCTLGDVVFALQGEANGGKRCFREGRRIQLRALSSWAAVATLFSQL